jgi:acetyltransferase
VAIADEVGWPVVLKLSAPHVRHKSDTGGIVLGIEDEPALRAAQAHLRSLAEADGARLLVERMEPPGVELIVSARTDAVVPALAIGMGGIWTESLADVVIVPLPLEAARVLGAIASLRGAPLFAGGRGGGVADLDAVCELALRVGDLLLDEGYGLIELNPVVVHGEGCVALDALIAAN